MRIFKNKWFSSFASDEGITDQDLVEAIGRVERGLIDANLGGGVIKQRIARPNQGRSGGFRTIVFFRTAERAMFVYGFPKNRLDNIRHAGIASVQRIGPRVFDSRGASGGSRHRRRCSD